MARRPALDVSHRRDLDSGAMSDAPEMPATSPRDENGDARPTTLTFIPDIRPPHDPLASGVPHNMGHHELEAWVRGDRFVSRRDRADYWVQVLGRLNSTLTHLNDQLDAIQEEFRAERGGSKPVPDQETRDHRNDVYRQLQETFMQYEMRRIVAEDTLRNILGLPGLAEDPGPR